MLIGGCFLYPFILRFISLTSAAYIFMCMSVSIRMIALQHLRRASLEQGWGTRPLTDRRSKIHSGSDFELISGLSSDSHDQSPSDAAVSRRLNRRAYRKHVVSR